ncbi:MAG: hypothetical protein IT361_14355 [Gemmatimonadaceae bacterium]|nr:hypothetical protein [Gemmatimonadaceae bacterium]
MSAIAGIFHGTARGAGTPSVGAMLEAATHRGDAGRTIGELAWGAVGVQRFAWEIAPGLAGPSHVVRDGPLIAVADATLYYVDDLCHRLTSAGVPAKRGDDATSLILGAYRAFGARCVHVLEGDFAFIVVDEAQRKVLLARDYVGRRPLHYALGGDTFLAASTARAIAASPAHRFPLQLSTIAAAVGGLLGGSLQTGFEGVLPVAAGAAVEWRPGAAPRVVEMWTPPEFRIGGRHDLEAGARELRALLVRAVAERAVEPVTTVWLSGGADSTAVFGATQLAAQQDSRAITIAPVTVSYPEGDSAREDHHVNAIAEQWHSKVTWIDSESVPVLVDAELSAAVRDDPYAHTFEQMNRQLARTSVAAGGRVAFDGYGGDQLFHVSTVYAADLLVRGRWRELAELRRSMESIGFRAFFVDCIVPWLPPGLWRRIQEARGRSTEELTSQSIPPWLGDAWREEALMKARVELDPPKRLFESPAAYESRWYTQTPFFPRAVSWSGAVALQGGVDVRSPLMDRRIIEFAASRPIGDRVSPGETKRVLRRAVEGLIPASVLAPRKSKTGVPRAYLHRRLREELAPWVHDVLLGSSPPRLADAGIIDVDRYRAGLARYEASGEHMIGVQLLLTLQAELWMRSVVG